MKNQIISCLEGLINNIDETISLDDLQKNINELISKRREILDRNLSRYWNTIERGKGMYYDGCAFWLDENGEYRSGAICDEDSTVYDTVQDTYNRYIYYPTKDIAKRSAFIKKFNDLCFAYKFNYDDRMDNDAGHYVYFDQAKRRYKTGYSDPNYACHVQIIIFHSIHVANRIVDYLNNNLDEWTPEWLTNKNEEENNNGK